MKESEAKTKTCPFLALVAVNTVHTAAVLGKSNKKLDAALEINDPFCVGSQCMMWDSWERTRRGETVYKG